MSDQEFISADSVNVLVDLLSRMDISVPPRGERRTNNHTERYSMAHLLSALSTADLLSFPLRVVSRERPDFFMEMSGVIVGVEHTEAVPTNNAHREALRQEGYGPNLYFISHDLPNDTKRSRETLLAEIEGDDPGAGWAGSAPEREWAQAMTHFVDHKVGKVAAPGFQKFEAQWLLVYDNWPVPAVELDAALRLFHSRCHDTRAFDTFARIFVITGEQICDLSESLSTVHSVRNLWRKEIM